MPGHPLHDLRLPGPTLVLVDDADGLALEALQGIEDVAGLAPHVVGVADLREPRRGWGSVLVVAGDRARLRRMVGGLPPLGMCRAFACWLTDAEVPWVLSPRPDWPAASHLVARHAGDRGVLTVARFSAGVRAQHVVLEMGRQAAGAGDTAQGGLVTAYAGRPPVPGLDPRTLVVADVADAGDPERDVPPDVVVAPAEGEVAVHPVTDRAPTVVTDPGPEPVDERVFNPVGYQKQWTEPVVDLADLARGPVTEAVVAAARAHQGVQVDPAVALSDLLALAMSGVPLVLPRLPDSALPLAAPLRDALAAGVDLDDPLRREEHSLAVRRAAFDHHSTLAWRSALATSAGVRH
ncbi:MAG: hypothetical protein LT071_05410, partial [Nocardioides sp.]|nr:hypothetical protein [Nocardioides sp.]